MANVSTGIPTIVQKNEIVSSAPTSAVGMQINFTAN